MDELKDFLRQELYEWKTVLERVGRVTGGKPKILDRNCETVCEYNRAPGLSVISASLNHARFLEDTILSIAHQSYQDFEHIVIDGGSTDGTIDILKRYPHIRWISEKDQSYEEAFQKGLAMAKGKYIMQCCVSDGYIDRHWFKRCVAALDSDKEVSLVWGFPQYLTEDSNLGDISYPQFHNTMPPQKHEWLVYWLKTNFHLPEGNLCVRKEVFDTCYPAFEEFSEYRDAWLEFNYNFNSSGYLPYHIPVVANFGRTHENQRGQSERERGLLRIRSKAYFRKVRHYRWNLLAGNVTHIYRDGAHNILPVQFSNKEFRREYIRFLENSMIDLAQKYLPTTFLAKLAKVKRICMKVV
jgi:glycosyltransferase involved in cell wall biosynthesis